MSKCVVSISGASTKIPFLIGCLHQLIRKGIKPTTYIGVSSGAITSFVFACGKELEAVKLSKGFTYKHFTNINPNSFLGNLIMSFNLLIGKTHLLNHDNLYDTLKNIVSEKDFKDWKISGGPDCHVGAVSYETGEKRYFNLKNYEYDTAIKLVVASSSIPIMSEGVKLFSSTWYDGGLRDHIGTEWYLKRQGISVKEVHSIYSRPKYFENLSKMPKKFVFKILNRSIQIMNWEISKTDEKLSDNLVKKHKIKHYKYFAPKTLTDSLYEVNKSQNTMLFDYGVDEANQVYRNT
jgi:predicted patatin/cPLA2 family phospholipase